MDNQERSKLEQWYYNNRYVNGDESIGRDAPFMYSIPRDKFTYEPGFSGLPDEELELVKLEMEEVQSQEKINQEAIAKLEEIDLKSIRALRDNDTEYLEQYRADAAKERLKIK